MRKYLLSRRNGKRQPANAKNGGKIMATWSLFAVRVSRISPLTRSPLASTLIITDAIKRASTNSLESHWITSFRPSKFVLTLWCDRRSQLRVFCYQTVSIKSHPCVLVIFALDGQQKHLEQREIGSGISVSFCHCLLPMKKKHETMACDKGLKLLNNIKEIQQKERDMDKIETDCVWVILKKVGPTFFKFTANRLDKGRFCSESVRVLNLWLTKGFPETP